MIRLTSLALVSALGVAGLASAQPAAAGPVVAVGVGVPFYAPGPYFHAYGPGYWHPDFYRHDFYRGHYGYFRGHYGYRR
jgi:hypothetical protein